MVQGHGRVARRHNGVDVYQNAVEWEVMPSQLGVGINVQSMPRTCNRADTRSPDPIISNHRKNVPQSPAHSTSPGTLW
jgi:hypothetical protein